MVTRYVSLSSSFDMDVFSQAVAREADEHGAEFVAQYINVNEKTVKGWISKHESSYGQFPYPQMTNLLKFCNAFGYDPRDFFALGDE
jgi:hypothetical protein